MLVAPTSAITSSTISSICVLGERLGHELLEDRELGLLRLRAVLPAAGAERLRRFDAALALALEHLQLLLLGKRALQLLLGVLERVEDEPERVPALGVAGLHGLLQLHLDCLDSAHAILPIGPPPRICQCRWKIVCPAPSPDVDDDTVIGQRFGRSSFGDEVEHSLGLLGRELADLAKAGDMPLRDDEQVRLRLRVDVADRDEALRRRHVVARPDELAEQAAGLRRQRFPPPTRRRPERGRTSPTGKSRATSQGE